MTMLLSAAAAAPAPTSLTSDQVLAFVLADIAIILVVSRLVGLFFRRLGQPFVVGEIVAGVLLGPTLLGATLFTWHHPWGFLHCGAALATTTPKVAGSITSCVFPPQSKSVLGVLGQLSLVFYMFLVGLELDMAALKGRMRGILVLAVGVTAIPIAVGFAVVPILFNKTFVAGFGTPAAPVKLGFTVFVGAMLSVTAFPVMARILQEKGLTQSAMGIAGVASAAVVTVLMFLTVTVAAGISTNASTSQLVLKFVYTAIYLGVMMYVVRPLLGPLGRRYEATGEMGGLMFATVAVMLFGSSFFAHIIGINVIVGGFIAGIALPAPRQRLFAALSSRLADVTGIILLPIFLAISGLGTDFTKLGVAAAPGLVVLIAAGIITKWAGGVVSARAGGLSWAEGNVLGVLLNCRGLLVLVVGLLVVQDKVGTPVLQVGGVLMALITTAMTGPLFDTFSRRLPRPSPTLAVAVPERAPGVRRVLALVHDLAAAGPIASAAYAVASGWKPAQVVLIRPFELKDQREAHLPRQGGAAGERDRSMRALAMVAGLAPPGVEVHADAFAMTGPAEDLVRLARDLDADAVVMGWRPIERDGPEVPSYRLIREAPSAVVAYRDHGQDTVQLGPVTLIGPDREGSVAAQLARNLASIHGTALDVRAADDRSLVDAARVSSALVIASAPPPAGHRIAEGNEFVLAVATCPVYVVREAGADIGPEPGADAVPSTAAGPA